MVSDVHVFPFRYVGLKPTSNGQNVSFRAHNGGEDESTLAWFEGEARNFSKHVEHFGNRNEVMQATERSSNVVCTCKHLAKSGLDDSAGKSPQQRVDAYIEKCT